MASPTSTWGLAGDAAGLVESFYRLDLDQGAWLDGMWRAMQALGARVGSPRRGLLHVELHLTGSGADALNINGIVVRDGNMLGASISASTLASPVDLSAQARRAWDRFAGHFSAALRLREQADPIVEGVLAADGRVLDARGDARSAPMRDALKRAARAIERARLRDRRSASAP